MSPIHRLLVVDDDPLSAHTLSEIFALNNYETHATCSALEALEWINKMRFDCVLSDIQMLEMNGVELLRAVK